MQKLEQTKNSQEIYKKIKKSQKLLQKVLTDCKK